MPSEAWNGTQSTHSNEEKPRVSDTAEGRLSSETSRGSISSNADHYDAHLRTMRSHQTELDLERHATTASGALSRIETQRYQHALTVGEGLKHRPSRAPLPPFGGGKPYPPPLPAREEYVVEFDGAEDPMYPQNWPTWTKYAHIFPPICYTYH